MTPDKVRLARQLYDSREQTVEAIAKTLGVSRASIYRATWTRPRPAGVDRLPNGQGERATGQMSLGDSFLTDTPNSTTGRREGYNFPYLKDLDATLARAFGVARTPEVCVLDKHRVLRYRGRVFDARDPARVRRHDLREALDDILANRWLTDG